MGAMVGPITQRVLMVAIVQVIVNVQVIAHQDNIIVVAITVIVVMLRIAQEVREQR